MLNREQVQAIKERNYAVLKKIIDKQPLPNMQQDLAIACNDLQKLCDEAKRLYDLVDELFEDIEKKGGGLA